MANLYKRAVPHLHYFSSDITRSFKAMDCVILYRIDEIYSILSDVFLTFSSKDVQNCSILSEIFIMRKKKECMTADCYCELDIRLLLFGSHLLNKKRSIGLFLDLRL